MYIYILYYMIYINIYYYIYIYIADFPCQQDDMAEEKNRLVYRQVMTSLTWKRDEITGGWRVETTAMTWSGSGSVMMIGDLHRFHSAFIPRIANDFLNPASHGGAQLQVGLVTFEFTNELDF